MGKVTYVLDDKVDNQITAKNNSSFKMTGSANPDIPSASQPDLPKGISLQDDVSGHIQEIIANLIDVLQHNVIDLVQKCKDMEMHLYALPVLVGITSGSIIAMLTHQLIVWTKTNKNA